MRKVLVLILVIAAIGGTLYWRSAGGEGGRQGIVLYGNVDLRQVALAFSSVERVAEMRVEEGDRVSAGQVLATLDTDLLQLRIAQVEAQVRVQQEALNRLRSGSRPQEIAQAQAQTAVAEAERTQARQQLERLQGIQRDSDGKAVAEADIEAAEARVAVLEATVRRAREAQSLVMAGPAVEDIARAQAQLEAAQAEHAVLQQQLSNAALTAPMEAVVRSRLLEPGDMASPQRPAYTLAIVEPKWVRAYVSETDLGRVREGLSARVYIDSFPDEAFSARVGYIASVAEFTPRAVQTEDLRSSLVYEIRVRVEDPDNRLRLGMPATVNLDTDDNGAR
ncbi:MAG: HlyD family efflux transporter periplasmic adaptor subunit [Pseudomonadales bacterium]|nr:HlyD family efflux transporter periplasmic adaptor subunit [Pseudomonadales bacterium]